MLLVSATLATLPGVNFVFPRSDLWRCPGPADFNLNLTEDEFMVKLRSRSNPSITDNNQICIEAISIIKDHICGLTFYKELVAESAQLSDLCQKPVTECTASDPRNTKTYDIDEIVQSFLNRFWEIYSTIFYAHTGRHDPADTLIIAYKSERFLNAGFYKIFAPRLAEFVEKFTGYSLLFDPTDPKMFGFFMHAYTSVVKRMEKLIRTQYLDEDKTFPTLWTLKNIESVLSKSQFESLFQADYADVESVCAQILTELKQECTLSNVSDGGCCPICRNNFRQVVAVPKCQHLLCHECIKKVHACHLCRGDKRDAEFRNVKNLRTENHEIHPPYNHNI